MRVISIIFCFLLLLAPTQAIAKSVFVNDQLRVGVRPEPSQVVAPIGVVLTGMKLQVLERKQPFIKIRTDKGLEGWIKDIYVTDKTPAILRLKGLNKKYQDLQRQLADIEKTRVALEEANSILNDKIDSLKVQRAELQRSQAIQIVSSVKSASGVQIIWLVISLIAGLVIGYFWHRHQSMKRLGGLRI